MYRSLAAPGASVDQAEAADLLNELEEERSEQILEKMQPEEKEEVEELLEFRDDTAGGLMDPGYLSLPENATVTDAMETLKKNEEIVEDLHTLFLVDSEGRLRFTVLLAKLFFASGNTSLADLAAEPLLYVYADEKQDRITELFDKYNLLTLPVVDPEQRLIGVITVDDVVAVLRQG